MTQLEKEEIVAAVLLALLLRQKGSRRSQDCSDERGPAQIVKGPRGPSGPAGPAGPSGPKGDRGPAGDSSACLNPAWEIWVDFNSTDSTEDGSHCHPFRSMASACERWATMPGQLVRVLVGGSGHLESLPFTVAPGCVGTIEGLANRRPSLGAMAMSSTALDGGIRLRYVQVASITIADGPGAAPGDLARLTIEDSRVAGPITSLPGAHAALLIANGSSRPTLLTSALTESSTELDGNIDLRSGSIVANNVRLTGSLTTGAFHLFGCHRAGTPLALVSASRQSSFYETQFDDPFVITSDLPAEVLFDPDTAESFGLIGADCAADVSPVCAGYGPQLLRCSSALPAFCAVRSSGAGTVEPAATCPDNEVIGLAFPSANLGEIALIWPSGSTIPASPGASGIYFRDDATGDATNAPPAGSQRLFHCDTSRSHVAPSYQQS